MGKNIEKVQDMVDGNFKRKIQSGYTASEPTRKVGDKWEDVDGGDKVYTPYGKDIPKIESVSCWDLYPDPIATNM